MTDAIQALEQRIASLNDQLATLRAEAEPLAGIPNYTFDTVTGPVDLLSLFAGKDTLFAIHNMGQGCRWCTLWADGLNGFLPHLEDKFSVVLLSKDPPELQQRMAHSRGWRFRLASHGGGAYIDEQSVDGEEGNAPGIVCYQRDGDNISRKAAAEFGPGDQFCSMWSILALAGIDSEAWTPQYRYWGASDPGAMDDGGQDVR